MKKNYTNQATKAYSSLYSEDGPKSKAAPNFTGGENVHSAKLKATKVEPLKETPVNKYKLAENINAGEQRRLAQSDAMEKKKRRKERILIGSAAGLMGLYEAVVAPIYKKRSQNNDKLVK